MENLPQRVNAFEQPGGVRGYDEILDARSPVEFAEDHIPGAVNLPVLSDAERVEVGKLYSECAFSARKLGASLVARNISYHLVNHLISKPKTYRPLVYCQRGGLRSASLSTVLSQVGWRITVLAGGYKTYRAHVRRQLDAMPPQFDFRVLAGATGTAKTRLLHALMDRGEQVLDLESLANHRGSVLGPCGPQPPQKRFESGLLEKLESFGNGRPVWIEAESHRIGRLFLPNRLWETMRSATVVEIEMPRSARIRHLIENYTHLSANPSQLRSMLLRLEGRIGRRQLEAWDRLIDAADWPALVESLLERHYDPAYAQSAKHFVGSAVRVRLDDGGAVAIEKLAVELAGNGHRV